MAVATRVPVVDHVHIAILWTEKRRIESRIANIRAVSPDPVGRVAARLCAQEAARKRILTELLPDAYGMTAEAFEQRRPELEH